MLTPSLIIGLLFYSKLPNTEEVLWADDLVIGDEYYTFGGWLLTSGIQLFCAWK